MAGKLPASRPSSALSCYHRFNPQASLRIRLCLPTLHADFPEAVPAPLTVTPEGQAVAPLPVGPPGRTSLVGAVALGAQAPVGLAGSGQAAQLAVLVHGVAEPVDARVL